jgi:hypothetical protein
MQKRRLTICLHEFIDMGGETMPHFIFLLLKRSALNLLILLNLNK